MPLADRPATIDGFLRLGGRPRVIAHRGFSGRAPENTLAAFRRAVEIGADMVELDVLLSRDGELVVIHDDRLDRTTNLRGKVEDLTLAELRRADAGSWFAPEFAGEPIPTLAEVIDTIRGRLLLNVEIKTEAVTDHASGGVVDKTLRLLRDLGMRDQTILSSFDPRAVLQSRAFDPGLRTAALYNADLQSGSTPAQIIAELGCDGFNLAIEETTREIVEECHQLGRPVSVYTVNDEPAMRRMIDLGVDALFTNNPDVMIALLEREAPPSSGRT